MSFKNIKKLTQYTKVEPITYFIDAQVWIYSMNSFEDKKWWEERYIKFFFDIIESDINPKPKILVSTLLISEIINTYLRQVAMPEYKLFNDVSKNDSFNFKKDYRITNHYKNSYKQVCDDIFSYKESILFCNDSSIISNAESILKADISAFDFNDYSYYLLCKEFSKDNTIKILTNDGDFMVKDIDMITLNKDLLNLK